MSWGTARRDVEETMRKIRGHWVERHSDDLHERARLLDRDPETRAVAAHRIAVLELAVEGARASSRSHDWWEREIEAACSVGLTVDQVANLVRGTRYGVAPTALVAAVDRRLLRRHEYKGLEGLRLSRWRRLVIRLEDATGQPVESLEGLAMGVVFGVGAWLLVRWVTS